MRKRVWAMVLAVAMVLSLMVVPVSADTTTVYLVDSVTTERADGYTCTESYTYDESGNVLTDTFSDSEGYTDTSVYTYDDSGNLSTIDSTDSEGTTRTYTYTYNESGNLLSETYAESYAEGEDNTWGYTDTFTYDENGNRSAKSRLYSDGIIASSIYTYDEDGNLLTEVYSYSDSDGAAYVFTWTYDSYGNVVTETAEKDGTVYYTGTYTYTYDANGNALALTYANSDEEAYTRYYTYDGHENLLVETEYRDGELYSTTTYSYITMTIDPEPTDPEPTEPITGTYGYLTYTISDGEVTIDSCDESASGELEIPDTIEGYPVTTIGYEAFYGCDNLTGITIPNSVTSISNYAFEFCTNLTGIAIPDSVISIGGYAFAFCTSLTSVFIGSGVTRIGSSAFNYCTNLTSITVSESNESYMSEDDVLFNKEQTSLILCQKGKSGNYAIPDGVTSIGSYAFGWCVSLTSITIPDSVTSIGSSAFDYCTGLTSITIPDSVTSIGSYAFESCESVTDITLGSGVTSIGNDVFDYCTSLTSIAVSNDNASYMSEDGVLFNKEQTTLIRCPEGKAGSYTIPDSVTSIYWSVYYGSAFSGCTNLTSITIGNGVSSIDYYLFSGCTGLTSVTISDSVTSIGYYAFYGCSSLTSITIPDSVTSIGDSAFRACTSLTNVIIGSGVTSIRSEAFAYCTSLTTIIFKGDQPDFPVGALEVSRAFLDVTATAYYPADNDTWTGMGTYSGTITWVAYDPDSPCITGHTEGEAVIENEVAATETEDGSYDIVVYCTVCGEELSRETVIVPATGSTDPEPTEPTDPEPTEPTDPEPTDPEPTDPEPTEENPFTDVDETNYFYDAVLWAIENGITSGTSETTFSPYQEAERCQVVTFLWRAAGCPNPTNTENPFTDVSESDYFYTAVLWAVEKGITSGTTATTFSPYAKCERCQVVTFLYRYFGEPAVTTGSNSFTDVNTSNYFYNAVQWAVQNGITSGTTATTFGPFVTCERCMVVTFLYRALVE